MVQQIATTNVIVAQLEDTKKSECLSTGGCDLTNAFPPTQRKIPPDNES